MDINTIANKIADAYLKSNCDMNDSIAKYASDNNLSIEHTKRLVEEANKQCYLMKLASTGEQTFDVAHYDEIKKKLGHSEKIEKKANVITPLEYNGEGLNKVAEENNSYTISDIRAAIDCCRKRKGNALSKIAELKIKLAHENPDFYTSDIEKVASNEIKIKLKEIDNQNKIINCLEKKAGLMSAAAGATLKGGATVGGKIAGTIANNPMKSTILYGSLQEAKGRAMQTKENIRREMISNTPSLDKIADVNILGTAGTAAENALLEKSPGIWSGAGKALSAAAPYALAMGAIGVTAAAARGIGGIAARMMRERQLNNAFKTISENNADIRGIPHARDYFDVVARHSPSLAMDPLVAPQLIRNFDSFGGVDVNTVGKLREIENNQGYQDKPLEFAGNFLGGMDRIRTLGEDDHQRRLNLAKIVEIHKGRKNEVGKKATESGRHG
jgi:hypothetical protein